MITVINANAQENFLAKAFPPYSARSCAGLFFEVLCCKIVVNNSINIFIRQLISYKPLHSAYKLTQGAYSQHLRRLIKLCRVFFHRRNVMEVNFHVTNPLWTSH